MSRRKCCCKGVSPPDPDDPDPDPPPPPPGICSQNPKYVTQSINHGFDYDCNPRGPDGFFYDDWCNRKPIFNFKDQNGDFIVDNYSGKHWTIGNTKVFLGSTRFYDWGPPYNAIATSTPASVLHRFHVEPENVFQVGYKVTGECDLGFARFNQLGVDTTGWGGVNLLSGNIAPYPKFITFTARLGSFSISGVSQADTLVGSSFNSLGLPYVDAYYTTTLWLTNANGSTVYATSTFDTPLSHFYNTYPTSTFSMEVTAIEVKETGQRRLTVDWDITHGGNSLVVEDFEFNSSNCWLDNFLYSTCRESLFRVMGDGGNGSAINQYTTYDDGVALAPNYPNIAFCFGGIDNFKWNWTV